MRAAGAMVALIVMGGIAQAEPCVTVSATDPGDAAVIKRELLALVPVTPHACLDVTVESVVRYAGDEIALVESVRVMISDDHGRMMSVVSGGATAHAVRGSHKLRLYRYDALEQAVDGLAPAIRTHLAPPARPAS
jgi:hypothetical protein